MKIVHVVQYYNDGMGYQENVLPHYQAKLGHEVVVIASNLTNGYLSKDRVKTIGIKHENGFLVKRIPVKSEFKSRFVIFKDLYCALEEEKPDYIYHYSSTTPSIKDIARYKRNHPDTFVAVDNHGDLNNSGKNKIWRTVNYGLFWRAFLKKYDSQIDAYFGVTPNRCLFLEEELGAPKNKVRFLPLGSDVDNAKITCTKEEFFSKYNIDTDKFIITNGGKITPEKEVFKVLEAFSRIQDDDVSLVLFGKMADPKVEELITRDKRIKYIGWLNRQDTLAMLEYSDIGIWNRLHTTLLEDSIAVGLPLILRYYGNTSHLIRNSGLYLYEGSVREIQDKLDFVIHHRNIVREFSKNSAELLKILSYDNLAAESIAYMHDMSPKTAHKTFMSQAFTDFSYKDLRFIK